MRYKSIKSLTIGQKKQGMFLKMIIKKCKNEDKGAV